MEHIVCILYAAYNIRLIAVAYSMKHKKIPLISNLPCVPGVFIIDFLASYFCTVLKNKKFEFAFLVFSKKNRDKIILFEKLFESLRIVGPVLRNIINQGRLG